MKYRLYLKFCEFAIKKKRNKKKILIFLSSFQDLKNNLVTKKLSFMFKYELHLDVGTIKCENQRNILYVLFSIVNIGYLFIALTSGAIILHQ